MLYGGSYYGGIYYGATSSPLWSVCLTCGTRWTSEQLESSYFFSSVTKAKNSYTSAKAILEADEYILTCPLDPDASKPSEGRTPSGGLMMRGDDRSTSGDETHYSKYEI